MANTYNQFDKRLSRIQRGRARMVHGYVSVVGKDGLIVMKPRRKKSGLPVRALMIIAVGFLIFKGLLLANLGPVTYDERLERLQQGTLVEQSGAWVMQADPVSAFLATKIRPLIN